MENNDKISLISKTLSELMDDPSISKSLKRSLENVINILKNNDDIKIKCNKALQELEGVSDDISIDSYMRTQIWNIVSLLEEVSLCSQRLKKSF